MAEDTATTISRSAARVSFAAAALFVVLLTSLHFIEPEFDPSWRFISEYALGRYGWMMMLAFLSLAVSYVALFMAIRSHLRTVAGRIGLVLMLICAFGLVLAGVFTTDPVTVSPEAATLSGTLHGAGGTLCLAMPFAAAIIGWQLSRDRSWAFARRTLLCSAIIAVASTIAFIVFMIMVMPGDGRLGPDVPVGWPGRIEILAYSAWLMATALAATRVHEPECVSQVNTSLNRRGEPVVMAPKDALAMF